MRRFSSLLIAIGCAWGSPAVMAQAPPPTAFGFAVTPTGGAVLSGTSSLTVSSATPATPYGVSAALTDSEGVVTFFANPGAVSTGARLEVTPYGSAGTATPAALATFKAQKTGSNVALSATSGTIFQTATLIASLDGAIVSTIPVTLNGSTFATTASWPGWLTWKVKRTTRCWDYNGYASSPDLSAFGSSICEAAIAVGPVFNSSDGGVPVTIPGVGVVTADVLFLMSDPGPASAPTRYTSVSCVAANMASFTLDRMTIWAFHKRAQHASAGGALLSYTSSQLTLTPSGGPGLWGVDASGCASPSIGAEWLDPDSVGSTPIGSSISLEARGFNVGPPTVSLGSVTVTKVTGQLELSADFSAIASPTQRVEFLDNGSLVGSFPGQTGVLAVFHNWPTRCGEVLGPPWRFLVTWPYPVAVTRPGFPTPMIVTDIQVVSEGLVTSGVDTGFRLRCGGLSSLTIISEEEPTLPTPPFSLTASSPIGPGSVQLDFAAGPPNGVYFFPVTLFAGAYPGGWLFGLDISVSTLLGLWGAGFPYVGLLDAAGNFTLGPIPGLPSGLTFYAVGLAAPLSGTPVVHTSAFAYTIP